MHLSAYFYPSLLVEANNMQQIRKEIGSFFNPTGSNMQLHNSVFRQSMGANVSLTAMSLNRLCDRQHSQAAMYSQYNRTTNALLPIRKEKSSISPELLQNCTPSQGKYHRKDLSHKKENKQTQKSLFCRSWPCRKQTWP